jgi:glycosyltransferase involved in cell wall biosynthesis
MCINNIAKLCLILPTYNAEKTIKRAVDSVLPLIDDRDLNVKLFIVDDYSSDSTFKILNQYYSGLKNITIFRNDKNQGPGKSRNSALKIIDDGYVGFIDSDDELNATAYKKAFLDGLNKKANLITFDAAFMSSTQALFRYDYHRLTNSNYQLVRNCIRGDLDGSVIFSIYKKADLDIWEIKFSSNYYEDIVFNYSALMSFGNIHIAKEICYKKYNTQYSIVNTVSEKHIDGMIDASVLVRDFSILHGYSKYKQFKSDFEYGLCGYIAALVEGILRYEKKQDRLIALLRYLYDKLEHCYKIEFMVDRSETQKDRLATFFIRNFNATNTIEFLNGLNKLARL